MGRGHGGTRSGGAGGGIPSDAAISKMAQNFVEGKTLNPAEVTELLKGEIIIDHGYNRDTGKGWATNARSPEIEAMISNETGASPVQPSTRASNKVKEKYLKDYDAYHDRYMSAMSHGVSEYKKLIGRTKNAELKSLLANKVQTYQQYMSEAGGVRDWIHKNWRPK